MKTILTIAGSDSGGGAGIQADLKTFSAFGHFGTSAITSVTAQNTKGVTAIDPIEVDVVEKQIIAVVEDLKPAACKIGMLFSKEIVLTVAETLQNHHIPNVVVDPVMIATSGSILTEDDVVSLFFEKLFPLATLITPNRDEAEKLSQIKINDIESAKQSAEAIYDKCRAAVLVKGGDSNDDNATDILYDGKVFTFFEGERIATTNTHGTGCTLSSAIASCLADGHDLLYSIQIAKKYVFEAIKNAPCLGSGFGPLSHFWNIDIRKIDY